MKRLENFPVAIGFFGVIIGSLIVGIFQYQTYKSQQYDAAITKKEQILEKMYVTYAKTPYIKALQEKIVEAPTEEIAYQRLYQFENNREPIIANVFGEILMVNKMADLYFGNETSLVIDSVFNPSNHKDGWWNIPTNSLNRITQTMAKEISEDIHNQ